MKQITRIPVQPLTMTGQAVLLFEQLLSRGKHAALIVPDMFTVRMVQKAAGLPADRIFSASEPGSKWLRGKAFAVYVVDDEALCARGFERELPGEGAFLSLLRSRTRTFPDGHVYAFTESRPARPRPLGPRSQPSVFGSLSEPR